MVIPNDSYLLWLTAIFYFVAAAYLINKIKKERITILYSINVYLLGIATFFTLMGFFQIFNVKILALLGALAIVIGASTIARFPLKLEWPDKEKIVYVVLLLVSIVLVGYGFTNEVPFMIRVANYYAFLVAGLFTMGYILYTGFKAKEVRTQSFATGVSLGLCCVVAQGAVAIPLFPLLAISFFGITLKFPMIFALLSPIAFIYVLILDKVIKPKAA